MKVSYGNGYAPEVVKVHDLDWPRFVAGMSRVQTQADKSAAGWISPCVYANAYRKNENVTEAHGIGFDFDTGTQPADIVSKLDGLNFLLTSTFSHYADGKTPRYRVFIPYAEPITANIHTAHARVWNHFKALLPGIDLACADVARMWFVPAAPSDRIQLAEIQSRIDGSAFDWRSLPEQPLRPEPPRASNADGTFQPGTRHYDFMRFAAQLRRGGVDYDTAEETIRSKVHAIGADADVNEHIRSLRHVYEKYLAGESFETEPQKPISFAADPLPRDVLTADYPAHPCSIKGLLPQRCVSLFASLDGLGKSRLALLMSAHVACGRPFLGMMAVDAGPVYYLNKEDPATEALRRLRWILEDFTPAERELVLRNLRIASPDGLVELIGAGPNGVTVTPQTDALIEAIGPAKLVVLDTLSRMHGKDENSNSDMARLIAAGERISRSCGAAVMFVHHTGKAAARAGIEGAGASRGAHVLEGNSRSVIRLMEPSQEDWGMLSLPTGALKLVHSKFSYGPKMWPIWLKTNPRGVLEPFTPLQRHVEQVAADSL